MPHRYAVLWESAVDHRAWPVGLVVEQDDHVHVELRPDLGIPSRYDQPFDVRGPDMTVVTYRPGDRHYFDHVLLDLSRGFSIGKEGRVTQASSGVILKLMSRHVHSVLRREHAAVYCAAAKTPAVAAHQQRYYGGGEPDSTLERPQTAGDGALVAA